MDEATLETVKEQVIEEARRIVLEVAKEHIPGRRKAKRAARQLAAWVDDVTNTGIFDPIDGPVLKAIAVVIVELAYRWLKAEGAI